MDLRKLSQNNADALRKAIGEKLTCPMCGQKEFVVQGGFIHNDMQTSLESLVMFSSAALNTAAVVCQHCGFVSFHDLRVLARIGQQGGGNASE